MPVASGNTLSTVAIVLGIVAVFLVPILFGGIGIVLAFVAKSKGEQRAGVAVTVSIVGTLVGLLFGAIVGATLFG
ncbi:MAG: hypothetical protein EBS36_01140 [Actinobacteria bacterium]|nr:hypothetical protein [Actinomycetota bacterium]NBY14797.1 hypothetical protein [Actinomycetota bacterium]